MSNVNILSVLPTARAILEEVVVSRPPRLHPSLASVRLVARWRNRAVVDAGYLDNTDTLLSTVLTALRDQADELHRCLEFSEPVRRIEN